MGDLESVDDHNIEAWQVVQPDANSLANGGAEEKMVRAVWKTNKEQSHFPAPGPCYPVSTVVGRTVYTFEGCKESCAPRQTLLESMG